MIGEWQYLYVFRGYSERTSLNQHLSIALFIIASMFFIRLALISKIVRCHIQEKCLLLGRESFELFNRTARAITYDLLHHPSFGC